MRLLNQKDTIKEMNALAAANASFLFIIDYKREKAYVEKLDNIRSEECMYDFPQHSNTPRDITNLSAVEWKSYPPNLEEYRSHWEKVVRELRAGNSYLTNLTEKVRIETNLSLQDLYLRSKALYKLWVKDKFVCFSPEIFVRITNGNIYSYPMKGTIDGTIPNAEKILMDDKKESAEHATIVDLIRNDLGMVADDIEVTQYRYIDRLATNKGEILQTSSEIKGKLPLKYREHIGDIFFKLLPAGSITGAPKQKTMEIIEKAENYERGFYTGVMGIYQNGNVDSAVMIRFVEQQEGQLFFKAGGGITVQSDCKKEYDEIIQKVYVPIR